MDIDVDIDEVEVDIDSCFGCLKGGSKSVQILFNGKEAAVVLTLSNSDQSEPCRSPTDNYNTFTFESADGQQTE